MMRGVFVDAAGQETGEFEAKPRCGWDFCDACLDCLGCYADDYPCTDTEGEHVWAVYPERTFTFRQEMA